MFEFENPYISGIVFILEVLSIISLLYRNKSLRSQLLWISLIIFTNLFGVIIYWIITLKKRKETDCFDLQQQQKATTDCSNSKLPREILNILDKYSIKGHLYSQQEFIYRNKAVYKKLYDHIRDAKESIYICSYIFSFDKCNAILVRQLLKKVNSGVKVYIIVDAFGTNTLLSLRNIFRLLCLKYKGINLRTFTPLTKGIFSGSFNHRNHRKIYIFDSKTTFIGGANLSKDFLSDEKDVWQDSLIKFEGDLSYFYSKLFISDWNYVSSTKINQEFSLKSEIEINDKSLCAYPIPSGPDIQREVLYNVLSTAISRATKSVTIVTPYFVPPRPLFDIIKNSCLSGVKITVFIPLKTDTYLLNKLNYSYTDELKKYGVDIFYTYRKVHSKIVIIDDSYLFIGSVNFDYRSLLINYEVTTIFSDDKTVGEVTKFVTMLKNNSETQQQYCIKWKLLDKIIRLLSPIT